MNPLPPDSISDLLTQPTVSARRRWLDDAGYLNEEGLLTVLETATQQMHGDLSAAGQLANLCYQLADEVAPTIKPRTAYLQAQYATIQADFEAARAFIAEAKAGYLAQGNILNAGRTTVGLLRVLGDQGQYAAAITEATTTIEQLENLEQSAERDHILGLLHTNLCGCYLYTGDPIGALNAMDRVDQLAPEQPPTLRASFLNDRGLALLKLGRFDEATTLYETLLNDVDQDTFAHQHAIIATNMGFVYAESGRYADSLRVLQGAADILANQTSTTDLFYAHNYLGDVWRLLNLQPEAINAYTLAENGFRTDSIQYPLAMVLQGKGVVLARMGETALATAALQEAITLFETVGNDGMMGATLVDLAHIHLTNENGEQARNEAERAAGLVTTTHSPIEALRVYLCLVNVYIETGELGLAADNLANAETVSNNIGLTYLSHQVAIWRGRLAEANGEVEQAIIAYVQAIETVKEARTLLAQDTLRTAFLTNKLTPWNRLIDIYLERGDGESVEKAFALVDDARAQTLVELMQGRIDRQLTHNLSDEEQTRLQDLQLRLNAVYNDLFNPNGEQRGSYGMMHERALSLEREIKRLIHRFAPRKNTTRRVPTRVGRKALPDDLPILAWHTNGDEIMAFVHCGGRLQVKRHVTSVAAVQSLLNQMHSQWNRMKIGAAFVARHGKVLQKTAEQILHRLHTALIAPLQNMIPAGGDLVIIPHGLLHHIPFHALYDAEQETYMVDAYTISYAPSVTVFMLCQQRETPPIANGLNALIVGVSDPALTHVAAETAAVQPHIPNSTILLDETATQAAVKRRLPTIDLLHVASHALFRDDNPRFSAIRLQDAWVTAQDVAEWERTPAHVTLSACESGRAIIMGGDETIGLTRAFLSAGTSSLVVSLWLVQDETASRMMPLYYQHLHTMPPSAALREAQIAMREHYPHPWYWAGFVAIGKRDNHTHLATIHPPPLKSPPKGGRL